MALMDIHWNPTHRQLRQFGWIALVALPLAGWAVQHFTSPTELSATGASVIAGLFAVGVILAIVGTVAPHALQPVFVGAMIVTWPIGWVVREIMMVLIYYGLFMPTAIVFRLIGRDPLQRAIDRQAKSYWTPKKNPAHIEHYFRQV
jgi:hypothetical protein